jgi:lipid II:glycine glycyltransferase (peptidoglycan interpeptide bridge formation enzyme)
MLITERKYGIFNIVNIYFAEEPLLISIPNWDVVTYHTYKNWGNIKGYEKKLCLNATIDLSQPIDIIWNKIKRQHKRHIRHAERNGIKVSISNNYEEFYQLNKKFLTQKNYIDLFGLNILSSKFMKKYGILFIAKINDLMLCGNLYFHDENNVFLASSVYQVKDNNIDIKKMSIDANCSMHWEAMKYFKNLDINNYDLGNLGCDETTINHQISGGDYFKRCFAGVVTSKYEYRKFKSHFNKLLFNSWNFFRGE